MKNLKRAVRRAICVLLTAAMLCTDTGVTVYAAEGAEEKVLEGTVEETSTGEVQAEDGQTEEQSTEKDPSVGNERTEGNLAEEGETEGTLSEEAPVEEETANENSDGENTETDVTEEKPAAEDGTTEENSDVEAVKDTEDASVEESVSENDIEDVVEDLTMAARDIEDGVIACGEYKENGNDITWVIDADGKLTVEGTGEFSRSSDYNIDRAPWYSNCKSITSAEINVIGMTNASCMFYNCENLLSVDFGGFDTSQVTNMASMFENCKSLENMDVSSFDTKNVTNMWQMFCYCNSLIGIDVSSFDTKNVTSMGNMFYDCRSLASIDVSGFDTRKVTDMQGMFSGCRSLVSVDVSNFDIGNVWITGYMFSDCISLVDIDVSGFNTENVTAMGGMFRGCRSLASLDVSSFDTSNVTDMGNMFDGCRSLASLDVSSFDTSNVTDMTRMFYWCESLTSLDMSSFNTEYLTKADNMFEGCTSLFSIFTPRNIKETVVIPSGDWYDISGKIYTELPMDLPYSVLLERDAIPTVSTESIKATKVKTSYYVGDTVNTDDLTVRYYGSDGTVKILDNADYTVSQADTLTTGVNTLVITYGEMTATIELTVTKRDGGEESGIIASGEYKENGNNITWNINADGKLTVTGTGDYADNPSYLANPGARSPWYKHREKIKSAEIHVSGMTDASYMFNDCSKLASVDISNFDTSQVTSMYQMFDGCSSLTSLDVSNFNTGNVTNIDCMFSGCSNLTSIDLGNFNTSQVTNMRLMFSQCKNLTDLDVSCFDTSQVTDMSAMFSGCSKLTDLDVRDFDTSQVTDMSGMFSRCSNLIDLDVSNFDTGQVTDMSSMFYDCEKLASLDLSNFDTNQVTNMSRMFAGCNKLTSLNLNSFNTSQVTDMSYMFNACQYLTSLNLSGFNTSQVTTMESMFGTVSGLISLDLSNFDTSNVTNMGIMFTNCWGLTSLDVSNFDTSNVTDMSLMFANCSRLTSIDLSSFDTKNVTDMLSLLGLDDKLTTIHTPYNLKLSVQLPTGSWYQADGTTLTELPQNLDHSIVIKKNEVPLISALKIGKTKINYMCGETINLDDLTVTYYDTGSLAHELKSNDYTTNVNEIDMSTPGKKVLVITYNDGKSNLTGEIELTVVVPVESIMLSDDTLSLKVGEIATLTATVTPDNAADKTVTWVSSDRTVAEVEDGVVEAIAAGECTITASADGKSATCNVTVEYGANGLTVAVPVATPESGRQLTAGSKVTLTCETARAEIYYTTGNSEKALASPTEKSTRYTEPIIINEDMYIKAVAIKDDSRSKTVTLHYTVADAVDRVLKPYAVPGQGAVEKGTKVELKSDTSDAAIYYITGKNADMLGAVPVDDTHKYTEPIEITKDMVIKAIAKKDGMKDSDFSTFVYKIKATLTPPAAVPASGTVDRGEYISLNADSDSNIYYTMDQSNPTTSGSARLYESKIRVDGDLGSVMVIKAVAEKNGAYSEIITFTYTVSENTVKGLQVMLAGSEEFTYTGNAITPAIIVTNNGEELTEGEDYTVRYSNNVKAADKNAKKAPKITVTGKGNLTKSRSVTFSIMPKDIGDEEEVVGGNIVVVQGKTASPVLFYGSVKLNAKDFVNPDAKKKYSQDETITITGKGNFEGTRDIDVRVVDKKDLKKFTVTIDNQALKEEPLIYDGEAKTLDGCFEVFDTTDKSNPLEEYSDYAVIYPKDNINAGKVKFTVVGLGDYYGTVTKTYTIKPRVIKTDADGSMEVNVNDGDSYSFRNGGVIISDLAVTCDGNALIPGKDYKVTYSNNKKIYTGNKAKCTISFTGNYKGSNALVRKFNITPAVLDDVDQINGSISVAVGDMVYTGKPGAYKSIPYVTANGVLLKSADYKVSYYKDQDRKQVIDGKTASSSVNLADSDKQTVYVKIEGKGNYEGTLTAAYNVYRLTEDVIDLAKAKVNFVGGNKAEYTGEGVEPEIEVMYKSGKDWKKVDANDIGTYVKVTYINNVNKGKATVMINGSGGRYVGSKTAAFSITPKSMK